MARRGRGAWEAGGSRRTEVGAAGARAEVARV